jgi:pimeloyl-ACP methyl ester carboxylesterase
MLFPNSQPVFGLFDMSFAGYTNFAEMPGAEKYLRSKMDQTSVALSKSHPKMFKFFFDLMGASEKYMPETFYKAMIKDLCESDKEIAADPRFKKIFMEEINEAFRQGGLGVTTDAAVHYVDWGFKLKETGCKVHVFHGTEDHLVPFEYGKHLGENIPECRLHVLEGEGHLFPYKYLDLIFDTADDETGKR